MTHVSLFTGIGGLDLAAEAAGFETVLQVEREPYALKILARHWPSVPRITDVREVTSASVDRPITVISGGFPCQPFSKAARGRNLKWKDLSSEFIRVVQELRPTYVVAENVRGAIIDQVCTQLRNIGYRSTTEHSKASSFGLPHHRHRWWAIAYPNDKGKFLSSLHDAVAKLQTPQDDTWDAENLTRVFRATNGVPNRMDRLKALGNAVVPAQAYPIFAAIARTALQEATE
jgi:DNA (cytosine-5)-methyltransferase 1